MGADLIINALATQKIEKELDWDAGLKAIEDLAIDQDIADALMATNERDARETLSASLAVLRNSITIGDRDLDEVLFGEWKLYIFGGTSWGDSPGDGFDAISLLSEAPGILDAVGFSWPPLGSRWLPETWEGINWDPTTEDVE